MGLVALSMVALGTAACGGGSDEPVLYIGGIPDQDTSSLARRFETVADYLSGKLGVEVRYVPSVSYAALVTGFQHGDIQLGWFGGLTGVQARTVAPGSQAIAQRTRDAEFHSVFIVDADLPVVSLDDLENLTFTFGSESSTSGHLMPRYYMVQAGIDPDDDLRGEPSYSGSHDKTWKLVESGSFQAGALNEGVWEAAVEEGEVDLAKVRGFYTTPPYFDYNWTIHSTANDSFGNGFTERLRQVLTSLDPTDQVEGEILSLFNAETFIETNNDNYQAIEDIARQLEIIR